MKQLEEIPKAITPSQRANLKGVHRQTITESISRGGYIIVKTASKKAIEGYVRRYINPEELFQYIATEPKLMKKMRNFILSIDKKGH